MHRIIQPIIESHLVTLIQRLIINKGYIFLKIRKIYENTYPL